MPRSALPVQNRPTLLEFPSDLFSAGRELRKILSIGMEFCSSTLVLLGSVVLFGWFSHNQAFMSVLPGRVSMKPNAALAFLTLGIALYLRNSQASSAKLWSRVLSLLVLGLAGLTLIEYAFHIDLHIDQMLFPDPLQNPNPGRMALISAVSFVLGGTSLILLTGTQLWRKVSQTLALVLTSIALTSIVGYLYGVPVLYGSFRNVNTMALHTGLGFLVLGFALVLGDDQSTISRLFVGVDTASHLVRRLFPLVLVIPLLLGYLYLRPAVNFGQLRFGMALFAVTLVLTGTFGLILVARLSKPHRSSTQRNGPSSARVRCGSRTERT